MGAASLLLGSLDGRATLLVSALALLLPGKLGKLIGGAGIAVSVYKLALDAKVIEGVTADLGAITLKPSAPPEAYRIAIIDPEWQGAVSGPGVGVTVQLRNPWSEPVTFQPVVTLTDTESGATARAVAQPITVDPGEVLTRTITVDASSIPVHGAVFGIFGGAVPLQIEARPLPVLAAGMAVDRRVAVLVA